MYKSSVNIISSLISIEQLYLLLYHLGGGFNFEIYIEKKAYNFRLAMVSLLLILTLKWNENTFCMV
jgi:hypothetical protein